MKSEGRKRRYENTKDKTFRTRALCGFGDAVPPPEYDGNRELNGEEKTLEAACEQFRKSKLRKYTFSVSAEITEEFFGSMIRTELIENYGLSSDITIEFDPDMIEEFKGEFRDLLSGGAVIENFWYTVKLPTGSYFDSYIGVMMTKS